MEQENLDRKLVAILSADVCGYSRLMGQDEEATLSQLTRSREVFSEHIDRNKGRIVNTTGDAILAEFASLVNALRCAVAVQRELGELNADLPETHRMEFRIGINLGDVMVKGDDIFGDGVNIAARLESIADVGGICISANAYENVRNKLRYRFEYLGEQWVKNIDYPIAAYRVLGDGATMKLAEFGESAARALLNFPEMAMRKIGELPERTVHRLGMLPKAAWHEVSQWPDAAWSRISKIPDTAWNQLSSYPAPLLRKIVSLPESAWKELTSLPESTLGALSRLPETMQRQLFFGGEGEDGISPPVPRKIRKKAWVFAGSGGLVLLGGALALFIEAYEPEIIPSIPIVPFREGGFTVPPPPSLAVLPFESIGSESRQFADGLTEDLITDLSKLPRISVASKKFVKEISAENVNVRNLGERLGVNYVLEGSVRRSDGQVRITAQLVDIHTGNSLWAERFDRAEGNPFTLQSEIVRRIIEEMDVLLIDGEQARDLHGALGNVKSAESARAAIHAFREGTPEGDAQAKQLYQNAIRIDPQSGRWHALFGLVFEREFRLGWSPLPEQSLRIAKDQANKALALSPEDPFAHVLQGYLLLHEGRFDAAWDELELAQASSPESADVAADRAEALNFLGRPDEALAELQRSMRLSPQFPSHYLLVLADSHLLAGEPKQAVGVIESTLESYPGHFVYWPYVQLTLAEAASNHWGDARKAMEDVLERMPDFKPSQLDSHPFRDREVLTKRKQLLERAMPGE